MTETDPSQSSPAKPPPSFGDVAKRIRSRTTDLLAIAVIAVGAIAVGTRVSGWFDEDETPPPAQSAAETVGGPGIALGNEPLTLDFGNSPYRMHRSPVSGDRKRAVNALLKRCRELGTASAAPESPPALAEQKLLAKLTTRKPAQELPDGGRLYRFDGPVAMASFTRPVKTGDANGARRVVCWGLAFPAGEKQWTLSLFTPAGRTPPDGDLPVIPLPDDARPILTIRGAQSAWRTFRSGDPVERIQRFYESWFEQNGWTQQPASSQSGWTAVFVKTTTKTFRAEVQVAEGHPGRVTGVLVLSRTK